MVPVPKDVLTQYQGEATPRWLVHFLRDTEGQPGGITNLILDLRKAYCRAYSFKDPAEINTGWCEHFALLVAYLIGDEAQVWWDTELDKEFSYDDFWGGGGHHAFVYYRGRYYDSECPEGIDDWRNLPIYVQKLKAPCIPDKVRRTILAIREDTGRAVPLDKIYELIECHQSCHVPAADRYPMSATGRV